MTPTGTPQDKFLVENHGDDITYELALTATDADGKSASTSVTIRPRTVQITLNTVPAGLQVVWGGETGTSPMTRTAIVNSTHTIFTPTQQGAFTFDHWSDQGAQSHDVVAGTTNATYTATFTGSGGQAFPTLVSSTGNLNQTANSSTFTVNFGFTANAGDLIVVAVCQDGGNGTITHSWSGGFNELFDRDAGFIICSAGYKIAAGGETNVVVTNSALSDHWSGLVWRFTGAGIPTAPTPATGNTPTRTRPSTLLRAASTTTSGSAVTALTCRRCPPTPALRRPVTATSSSRTTPWRAARRSGAARAATRPPARPGHVHDERHRDMAGVHDRRAASGRLDDAPERYDVDVGHEWLWAGGA